MKFFLRHIATLIIYSVVLVLSVAKFGELVQVPFSGWDKFVHLCMYAALAAIMTFEQHFHVVPQMLSKSDFVKLILLAVVYGVVIEFVQMVLPYRSGEVADAIANTIGAFVGVAVAASICRARWYVNLVLKIKRLGFKK